MNAKAKRKKEENDILYKMYESGMSLSAIARILHINKGNLSKRFTEDERLASLREERKKNEKNIGTFLCENKEKVRKMMQEGMTIEEMALILKCKKGSLYYWLYKKKILEK